MLLLAMCLEIIFQCARHGGELLGGCLKVEPQAFFLNGLGRGRPEGGYLDVALLEVGHVFLECFHARRTEEHEHVVVEMGPLLVGEIVAHRAIHHAFGVAEPFLVEQILHVVVVDTAHWHEKLIAPVLRHQRHKIGHLAGSAEEHLALAILHILLDVECDV